MSRALRLGPEHVARGGVERVGEHGSAVEGPGAVEHTHYLRVHMAALRRKIERDPARPQWLVTEPGVGYRFHGS